MRSQLPVHGHLTTTTLRKMTTLTIAAMTLLAVTSFPMTQAWGVRRGAKMDFGCQLCTSKCEIEGCVCINACIEGTGNDCYRFQPQKLGGSARNCVRDCRATTAQCLTENCGPECP